MYESIQGTTFSQLRSGVPSHAGTFPIGGVLSSPEGLKEINLVLKIQNADQNILVL